MATEQEGLKIYFPVTEAERLRAAAKEEDRSITAIVRRAVRAYLDEREKVAA